MQVKNLEKKEKSTVSFEVIIGADEFEKALQSAYLKNRSKIYVQGFRKGKAPRMVIEGMYGKEVFYDEAADELAPGAFQFAITEEKIRNVGTPTIRSIDVSESKELTLGFLTAVWPEVKLGEYKGLEAPRAAVAVTDEQVDADIQRTLKRSARMVNVERPAQDGDFAIIDYEGSVDGVPFAGGKDEGHRLLLGSGSFIPGFEDQVIGMSAGEEKDINVTFPEQYHSEELAGKAAVFHVKCNAVQEEQLPELDDEFVKDISEFDTLEAYKANIREGLEKAANEAADSEFHSALLEKAAANMEVEIPEGMIEEQIDSMVNELDQNLQYQGLSLQMYLQYLNQDINTFRASNRPAAEARCRIQILVDKIAEVEAIECTEEEIEAEYKNIADAYDTDVENVKQNVPVDAVTGDMRVRKAAELVYSTGVAVAPEAEEKPAPKKKAPAKKKAEPKAEEAAEAPADESEEKPAPKKKAPAKKKAEPKAEEAAEAPAAEGEEKPAPKKKAPAKKKAEPKEEAPAEAEAPAAE